MTLSHDTGTSGAEGVGQPTSGTAPVGAAAAPAKSIVELTAITKTYYRGKEPLTILDNLSLSIPEGGFEALMGPSGSGKSTLLNLIAGLDKPTSGTAMVAGSNLSTMSENELGRFRARHIGFIFQAYNLMPVLTAQENVELPLVLHGISRSERKRRAQVALRVAGLADRMHHYPRQLSGGQEQRVAIARAIVHDPTIIVADEPTGDLDRKSADDILGVLETLNKEFRKTIIMVTHDPAAAERATIIRRLNKAQLI